MSDTAYLEPQADSYATSLDRDARTSMRSGLAPPVSPSMPLTAGPQPAAQDNIVTLRDRGGEYRVPQADAHEQVAGVPGTSIAEPTKPNVSPLAVLPQEMQKVMTDLARPESGGNPNALYAGMTGESPGDMRQFPNKPGYKGFPDWPGKMGPQGISHAAAELQWQPDTWLAAADALGLDNFRDPIQRAKAGAWLAAKTYKEKTGRDIIADQKAGQDVVGVLHTKGSPWASSNPMNDARYGWAQDDRSTYERGIAESHATAERYRNVADAAPAGSAERATALREAREALRGAREKFDALTKIPPIYKPTEPMEQFGSMAVILAGLGGLFARQHMTAAMGAAGEAMQAHNQQNYDRFKIASDQWKTQLDMGLTSVKLAGDEIKAVLEDNKLAYDEKQARLNQIHTEYQMSHQSVEDAARHQEARDRVVERMQATRERLETMRLLAGQRPGAGVERDINAKADDLDREWLARPENSDKTTVPDDVHTQHRLEARTALKEATTAPNAKNQSAKAFVDEIKAKTGNAPTYQDWVKYSQETGRSQTGQLSEEAVELMARQYELGDPGAITSLPRSGPARIQVENKIAEHMKGMDDAASQIVLNRLKMAEARAAATTAGRVTMNTEIYSQEAKGAGQQVVETSKLFPRTNYPLVNSALRAYELNTGDPNIIKFGAALSQLINAYGKLSNPTGIGVHDADKERISKILDTRLSQGQVEAAVEQIIKEGEVVSNAARQAQVEVLRGVMPAIPGGASAAPPSASGGIPVPADHQSDADGTTYKGSDGKVYVKRGNQMVPK